MEILKPIDDIESSDEYLEWTTKHPDSYLAHAFTTVEKGKEYDWQIGYYNKENDRITTFQFDDENDSIVVNPESEMFKKDDTKILEIAREKIKIDIPDALSIFEDLQKEKYPKEIPSKTFFILQNLEVGQIYNITALTASMKTLNVKIDTETGNVLHEEMISVFDFKAK